MAEENPNTYFRESIIGNNEDIDNIINKMDGKQSKQSFSQESFDK